MDRKLQGDRRQAELELQYFCKTEIPLDSTLSYSRQTDHVGVAKLQTWETHIVGLVGAK